MRWLRNILLSARALFFKGQLENDLSDELQFHLQMEIEKNINAGMSPEEARYASFRSFGGVEQIKEQCRETRGVRLAEELGQDLRYGVRIFVKNPGFTGVAVLSLALGIGANSAIFSIADGLLFRPLPYEHPERLVTLMGMAKEMYSSIHAIDVVETQRYHRGIDGLVTFSPGPHHLLLGNERAELIGDETVSPNFLQVLGIRPLLGRAFRVEEHERGRDNAVIISYAFWQRRFGGDTAVLGRTLNFEKTNLEIVGVLRRDFVFPDSLNAPPDILTPMVIEHANNLGVSDRVYAPIARLKPTVSLQQAQAEMDSLVRAVRRQFPELPQDHSIRLVPLRRGLFAFTRPILLILLGAAALVLLIACANVASLLLARGLARQRELAIRAALGAGRARITRQLLCESLLLSLLSGMLGLAISYWTFDLLISQIPRRLNHFRIVTLGIDARVIVFTFVVSLLTACVIGVAPAFRLSRTDLTRSLREGPRKIGSFREGNVLVIAEVALGVALLIGAGLMLNSFLRLRSVDLGFQPANVLTLSLTEPATRHTDPTRRFLFYRQLLDHFNQLPGVQYAAGGSSITFIHPPEMPLMVRGRPLKNGGIYRVTSKYFSVLGISIIRGRVFSDDESLTGAPVALVSDSAARLLWPGQDPIGKQFTNGTKPPREVVGVVADCRQSLWRPAIAAMYIPFDPRAFRTMLIMVRTEGNPRGLISALQAAVSNFDRNVIATIYPLEYFLSEEISITRFQTVLLGLFATLAVLLALVGIYGLVHYSVTQRTQEIGIRVALGAQTTDVTKMVVRQGLGLAVTGVLAGAISALWLTRIISSWLYEVTPADPLTFAGASLFLVVLALIASYVPARRATRIDPMAALRYE